MKETRFIAQNKEKWQESENLLGNSAKDPEKMSTLFTQVIDDLSYARTYYPNRSVRVYLNKIAREYFSYIYRHQKARKNTLKEFWLDELPHIVYTSRKPLVISLIIFLFAAFIGIFSSMNDPEFATGILGDRYIAMTKANIEKGDPMAVYKEAHQVDMFLGITFNNLRVAFQTYVMGLFLSVGTVAILLYNGIMVGCFQFFFAERGLLAESALAIWLHGTLEISSIILAGGAGLTLGSGLLFPGTYSRLQAFQITAMRSLKLMLGISPLFILAGLIESFLTRYTDVPDVLRLLLILFSGFFILGYFVYYPWVKARRGFDKPLREVRLPSGIEDPVSVTRIKTNAEILSDAFVFFKKWSSKLFSRIAIITAGLTLMEVMAPVPRTDELLYLDEWVAFFGNLFYGARTGHPWFLAANAVGTALVLYQVFVLLRKDAGTQGRGLTSLIQCGAVTALFFGLLYALGNWGVFLGICSFMLFLLFAYSQFHERQFGDTLWRTWKLSAQDFGQVMGLQFTLLLMSFSFLVILSAPLLYINTSVLEWNFAETDMWARNLISFIETFMKLFIFNMLLPVLGASAGFLYFSLQEVYSAENLKKSIALVGVKGQSKK